MRNLYSFLLIAFTCVVAIQFSPAFAQHIDEDGVIHLTAEESAKLIEEKPNLTIIDVRTNGEYRDGHIVGAVNINYFSLNFKKQLSAYDPGSEYLVHCRSGKRSARAVRIMKSLGFENIYHLDGGVLAWNAAGLDLVKR